MFCDNYFYDDERHTRGARCRVIVGGLLILLILPAVASIIHAAMLPIHMFLSLRMSHAFAAMLMMISRVTLPLIYAC